MIKRTHLVIGLAAALIFLPHVKYKLVFFPVVLIASLLPDIDSPNSAIGHNSIFRPLQFFARHRGIFHSITFCILASLALAFVLPSIAFPFFLGYSLHLFADSFTQEGITPFWPWRKGSAGMLRTGGSIESSIFIGFLIADAILFLGLFF
ncbi:MAG: metal-dependent hydrolase [Candidatus Pacearchaeota archaeon]